MFICICISIHMKNIHAEISADSAKFVPAFSNNGCQF